MAERTTLVTAQNWSRKTPSVFGTVLWSKNDLIQTASPFGVNRGVHNVGQKEERAKEWKKERKQYERNQRNTCDSYGNYHVEMKMWGSEGE